MYTKIQAKSRSRGGAEKYGDEWYNLNSELETRVENLLQYVKPPLVPD